MKSTQRTRLLLPEYGRNVQEMVSYLKTIEDREKRNEQARVVVAIMGNVYPYKRDSEEFRHMLWDHLFMIADFDLDVDCPFELPTPELFMLKPQRVPYSQNQIHQKHYGSNAQRMIKKISETDAPEKDKNDALSIVAKFIRHQSHNFNNEFPSNNVILADIQKICGNNMQIDPNILNSSPVQQQANKQQQNKKQNMRNKNTRK